MASKRQPVVTSWTLVGPVGAPWTGTLEGCTYNPLPKYSGRILDIELEGPTGNLRTASAAGGAWETLHPSLPPTPISDTMCPDLNCLVTSTIATDPQHPRERFLVGTGETAWPDRPGRGIFWTLTSGASFVNAADATMTGDVVYRIRFAPTAPDVVFAATRNGVLMSQVSGATYSWAPTGLNTDTTDLVVMPATQGYATVWAVTRGGGPWTATYTPSGLGPWQQKPINAPGFVQANAGRMAITVSTATPLGNAWIYVQVANQAAGNTLMGIYRSVDGGANWSDVSPGMPQWFLDYANVIGASPANASRVLAGGVKLYVTRDGGASWLPAATVCNRLHLHDDHHAIAWSADGQRVAVGNDGGLSYAVDAGTADQPTWGTDYNLFPTHQFWRADAAGALNRSGFLGAAQDIGTFATTDGLNWKNSQCCDTYDAVMDDAENNQRMWVVNGYGAPQRYRSDNGGQDWSLIPTSGGLPATDQPTVRHDAWPTPVYVYTNGGSQVYRSIADYGNSFVQYGTIPSATQVDKIAVKRTSPFVYATKKGGPADRFWTSDCMPPYCPWVDRSNPAWPPNNYIARVVPHPTDDAVAYVVMDRPNVQAGGRVFRSRNHGQAWDNVTGDLATKLPTNVPAWDVAVDPSALNTLYLATETGCFRTTNAGDPSPTWTKWNNGWPAAVIVTSIRADLIDVSVRVTAGTWGRAIWTREAGDEP